MKCRLRENSSHEIALHRAILHPIFGAYAILSVEEIANNFVTEIDNLRLNVCISRLLPTRLVVWYNNLATVVQDAHINRTLKTT